MVRIYQFIVGCILIEYAIDVKPSTCSVLIFHLLPLDSFERHDPPRFAEATRNVLQEMEKWVHQDNLHDAPSSIFWLYGGAGVGKSALARTLAEKFKINDDLAASFFFFKADVNRNDGNRLIPGPPVDSIFSRANSHFSRKNPC